MNIFQRINNIKFNFNSKIFYIILLIFVVFSSLTAYLYFGNINFHSRKLLDTLKNENDTLVNKLNSLNYEFETLKKEDQRVKNATLESEINNINKTYKISISLFERIIDLREIHKVNTSNFDRLFINSLGLLSDRKYASAEGLLTELEKQLKTEEDKISAQQIQSSQTPKPKASSTPTPIVTDNNLPLNGYKRQYIQTERGVFLLDIIAANLVNTKVIVDTASPVDCTDSCPVLSLSEYVKRNNAIAGINGTYFCPASYPSCIGKTNSFDSLLMNSNKTYINLSKSSNASEPIAVFNGTQVNFLTHTRDWSKSTNIDAAISNYPLLIQRNNLVFSGSSDPKHNSKGPRSFISTKSQTVYIGVVYNANLIESTNVLTTLAMENALNLDSGGSTALWFNGYKAGPGRNIPNAILLVNR